MRVRAYYVVHAGVGKLLRPDALLLLGLVAVLDPPMDVDYHVLRAGGAGGGHVAVEPLLGVGVEQGVAALLRKVGLLGVEVGGVAQIPHLYAVNVHHHIAGLLGVAEKARMHQAVFVNAVKRVVNPANAGVAVVVVAHHNKVVTRIAERLEKGRGSIEVRTLLHLYHLRHIRRRGCDGRLKVAHYQIGLCKEIANEVEAFVKVVTGGGLPGLLLAGLAHKVARHHNNGLVVAA